ncbi:MAG: DUF4870 domain-containing protein [Candidatus Gastranaerophilales bacterium]|nr:DUF4870 domain-containing protein [Candidatus Gastranaerophilales bacterium]
MIKKFPIEFKDDTDRIIIVAMFICCFFPLLFIPPLVVILLLKKFISEKSYNIAKAFFNFQLLMFLISLIFVIPVVGWMLAIVAAPILYIANIVIIILALCSIIKGGEMKIPVPFEFV